MDNLQANMRWCDPRAKLLSGAAWEQHKILKDKVDSLMPRIDFPELLLEANRMKGG